MQERDEATAGESGLEQTRQGALEGQVSGAGGLSMVTARAPMWWGTRGEGRTCNFFLDCFSFLSGLGN